MPRTALRPIRAVLRSDHRAGYRQRRMAPSWPRSRATVRRDLLRAEVWAAAGRASRRRAGRAVLSGVPARGPAPARRERGRPAASPKPVPLPLVGADDPAAFPDGYRYRHFWALYWSGRPSQAGGRRREPPADDQRFMGLEVAPHSAPHAAPNVAGPIPARPRFPGGACPILGPEPGSRSAGAHACRYAVQEEDIDLGAGSTLAPPTGGAVCGPGRRGRGGWTGPRPVGGAGVGPGGAGRPAMPCASGQACPSGGVQCG